MRASVHWLRALSGLNDDDPEALAARLDALGLEVESVEPSPAAGYRDRLVVAEVRGRRPHPKRDKLQLVEVFDGAEVAEVVCGAPNVPEAGHRVLLARIGAVLPDGLEIAPREIAGVVSRGMLASESELGLGAEGGGIVVLGPDDPGAPGDPLTVVVPELDDTILELGVTPNRPDALGHRGLARDLAVAAGRPFPPEAEAGARPRVESVDGREGTAPGQGAAAAAVRVTLEDPDRCPRYGAMVVSGLTVRPSPLATRVRLHRLGFRAIDNLVDVTNLVLLEHGHPIHGFDLRRLRGATVVVRRARGGESMTTLDGVPRTLTDDDLLICDAEGPVALAGVMGGENSEMGPDTRDVLLECAWFEPRGVRRTARRAGLHTEASHRFERGVDRDGVPGVLADAARRLAEAGGGTVAPAGLDLRAAPTPRPTILFRPARAAAVLGIPVEPAAARRVLEGLGCTPVPSEAGATPAEPGEAAAAAFTVLAPSHRPDLTREIDLVEEVGRIRGFDAIPAVAPAIASAPSAGSADGIELALRLRQAATDRGLDEAVNYAFVAPDDLAAVGATADQVVALQNPLSVERSALRTSLLPGLAGNLRRARRHQEPRVRLFEVGRVFRPGASPGALPGESQRLGVLLAGPRDGWIGDAPPVDFYDGKGAVDGLVEAVTGRRPTFAVMADPPAEAPALHPARCAMVHLDGARLGVLGAIHPDVLDRFELGGESAVFAELDLDVLREILRGLGPPQAQPLPRFPAVTRDLALVLPRSHPAGEVAAALAEAGGALAEDVRLFDRYEGPTLPEGHHSLAFRVVYRSADETLTDAVVDRAHEDLTKAVERRFGAVRRGV
ncbi:MAG TPA: phenylalanine--tRNA ligase subunit beta [Polyangiaceae bacterium LLY-WYZ-14_1]|nr:phenylalanine--tRNA ligase subunit beta [Polyangiaceae bacterium LLY-WYZ-14_1]